VLNQLEAFGEGQARLHMSGVTVDPHQLLGIELNPRAAAISEVVLWIGYLQWHFRTRGNVMPPQPVLKDFHNIECRDAVLAYDRMGYVMDERGVPDSADFVMYWWDQAADLTRAAKLERFGLITTNSLRQTYNRAVIYRHSSEKPSLTLIFAVPDHPWVNSCSDSDDRRNNCNAFRRTRHRNGGTTYRRW